MNHDNNIAIALRAGYNLLLSLQVVVVRVVDAGAP